MTFASGTTPLFFLMTKYLFDESVLVNYCISSPGSKVAMLPIGYAALINHDQKVPSLFSRSRFRLLLNRHVLSPEGDRLGVLGLV